MKNNKLLIVLLSALLVSLSGCERIPRTEFEVTTIKGEVITLACPVVDKNASKISYLIDGDCIIYKKAN